MNRSRSSSSSVANADTSISGFTISARGFSLWSRSRNWLVPKAVLYILQPGELWVLRAA